MPPQFEFHERFGGELSLEQELVDLGRAMPPWMRPLWSLALRWILPWVRDLKIKATLEDVQQQAEHMADQWNAQERLQRLAAAAAAIQQQNPDARVAVVPIPGQQRDSEMGHAISVERPPLPGNLAQEALGFSSIEIRAPWTIDQQA